MRRLSGMIFIVMMALLLAACGGGDDEDSEPRGEGPGETTDNENVVEPTVPAETHATQIAQEATAADIEADIVASPAGGVEVTAESSPVAGEATPVTGASPVASPEDAMPVGAAASPVSEASPVASPVASPDITASPAAMTSPVTNTAMGAATSEVAASPVASTPPAVAVIPATETSASPVASPFVSSEASPAASVSLRGRVELAGAENTAWTMSGDGCVGLGSNSDLRAGHQVVIRDEAGVIVGVTTLDASDETEACAWDFALDVPESDYYAVSIPMKTELVFSHDEIEKNGGEITIVLR